MDHRLPYIPEILELQRLSILRSLKTWA